MDAVPPELTTMHPTVALPSARDGRHELSLMLFRLPALCKYCDKVMWDTKSMREERCSLTSMFCLHPTAVSPWPRRVDSCHVR